jgi:hypothetical protein
MGPNTNAAGSSDKDLFYREAERLIRDTSPVGTTVVINMREVDDFWLKWSANGGNGLSVKQFLQKEGRIPQDPAPPPPPPIDYAGWFKARPVFWRALATAVLAGVVVLLFIDRKSVRQTPLPPVASIEAAKPPAPSTSVAAADEAKEPAPAPAKPESAPAEPESAAAEQAPAPAPAPPAAAPPPAPEPPPQAPPPVAAAPPPAPPSPPATPPPPPAATPVPLRLQAQEEAFVTCRNWQYPEDCWNTSDDSRLFGCTQANASKFDHYTLVCRSGTWSSEDPYYLLARGDNVRIVLRRQ